MRLSVHHHFNSMIFLQVGFLCVEDHPCEQYRSAYRYAKIVIKGYKHLFFNLCSTRQLCDWQWFSLGLCILLPDCVKTINWLVGMTAQCGTSINCFLMPLGWPLDSGSHCNTTNRRNATDTRERCTSDMNWRSFSRLTYYIQVADTIFLYWHWINHELILMLLLVRRCSSPTVRLGCWHIWLSRYSSLLRQDPSRASPCNPHCHAG